MQNVTMKEIIQYDNRKFYTEGKYVSLSYILKLIDENTPFKIIRRKNVKEIHNGVEVRTTTKTVDKTHYLISLLYLVSQKFSEKGLKKIIKNRSNFAEI